MESIKELRKICQWPRRKYDTWHGINICRRISIYITKAIIPLGVSADFVTLVFMMVGILACLFFAIGKNFWFIIGVVTLQLWYVLDHVDGEVARYTKKTTATGIYFDKMVHYLVHTSYYFCLGWGVGRDLGDSTAVIIGYIAGISTLLITASEDLEHSTVLERLIFEGKEITFKGRDERGNLLDPKKKTLARSLFNFIHSMCTFPHDMNLLTVVVILKWLVFKALIYWFLLVYAVFSTLIWLSRLVFFIKTKKVDTEIKSLSK